jgi:pimeloyl-ACP methyl ester carboxylesterase
MEGEKFELDPMPGLKVAGKLLGQGPRLLVCLPGFGNDRDWFDPLLPYFPADFRVVVFDLPGFWGSSWVGEAPLGAEALRAWLAAVRAHFQVERVDLLGFSLGARVVMGMVAAAPEWIGGLVLLAPDGLRVHPVYGFAVYTWLGRALFRFVVRRPAGILGIVRILYALRILPGTIYRLALRQLETPERRARLYEAWMAWSGIRPDLGALSALSRTHGLHWHVVWGRQDEILDVRQGQRFARKVAGTSFYPLEGGHFFLRSPQPDLQAALATIFDAIKT